MKSKFKKGMWVKAIDKTAKNSMNLWMMTDDTKSEYGTVTEDTNKDGDVIVLFEGKQGDWQKHYFQPSDLVILDENEVDFLKHTGII
jgi:hypothetical protein